MADQEQDTSTSMADFWERQGTTSEQAIADYLAKHHITKEELESNLDHPSTLRKTLAELEAIVTSTQSED